MSSAPLGVACPTAVAFPCNAGVFEIISFALVAAGVGLVMSFSLTRKVRFICIWIGVLSSVPR